MEKTRHYLFYFRLDKASSSYKDIDVVMDNQSDLAEIVVKLSPLAVLKGYIKLPIN